MITIDYREYSSDIKVVNVECDEWEEFQERNESFYWNQSPTNIRVSVPDNFDKQKLLDDHYIFADRMFYVSINLSKSKIDYERFIRITPELTTENKEAIKQIAHRNFLKDRRFHVDIHYNQQKANCIMDQWIDELEQVYICRFQKEIAGFLAVREIDKKTAYIHMAAVEEKFRPAGIALSMYSYVIKEYRQKGYKRIQGYISSSNLPVLNLYTFLGATFEKTTDIYIKEVR